MVNVRLACFKLTFYFFFYLALKSYYVRKKHIKNQSSHHFNEVYTYINVNINIVSIIMCLNATNCVSCVNIPFFCTSYVLFCSLFCLPVPRVRLLWHLRQDSSVQTRHVYKQHPPAG